MNSRKISRRFFLSATAMAGFVTAFDWGGVNALAARIKPKKDYPVAVIGAGLGGLCCGALLAKQGFPVTVVEQHDVPGGYASTFDRAGGAFTFDVSLHRTSIDNDTLRLFKELDVLDKIELVKISDATRIIRPAHETEIRSNRQWMENYLCEQFPHEQKGVRDYFAEARGVAAELQALETDKSRRDFPSRYPRLWNLRDKTLAAFVGAYVKDPAIQEFLTIGWGSYGLPPSELAAFYYLVATMTGKDEPCYIKRRSQDLSDALAETIEAHGGRMLYGTTVEKIMMKDNAVSGVVTKDEKHAPAKIIVSNGSAVTTLRKMLPPNTLPTDYSGRISGFRPSISTFIVWLGLNRDIRSTIKDSHITVSSGGGAEAHYRHCLEGAVEQLPVSVVIYDNYYEGYSKPGSSTITLTTLSGYEPWRRFESDYKAGRKEAYHKEKERWAGALLQKVEEKAIPGLTSMIEVKEAATPLTNWRFTRNTQGAVYGFEQSVDNSFMNRIKNRTPVKGLYLSGAWGNPGGGYGGALSGAQNAFARIMKDWA